MSLEVTALTSYITVVTNQDETVTVTTQNPSPSQTAILFEDEGTALGTRGTVNEIDFAGSGVTATRSGDKVTVTVSSGGGGGTWGSITGTLSNQTDLQTALNAKQATLVSATNIKTINSSSVLGSGNINVGGLRVYNVEDYGAVHNGVRLTDAAITSGTNILTSASASFTANDVGKVISIAGAGAAGVNLTTTISGFTNSTTVTITINASTSVTGKQVWYGTDDTSSIQNALNAAFTNNGGTVYLPNGIYIINGALQTSVSSTNPNCQIYIPQSSDSDATSSTGIPKINIIGESRYSWTFYAGFINSGVRLVSTLVSGSGTNPSVLGTIGPTGSYLNYNFVETVIENISILVNSNGGASAPNISAFNGQYLAKVSGKYCVFSIDSDVTTSTNPSGNEVFGAIISGYNNDGPNTWSNSTATGFKYGWVIGEHSSLDRITALGNYNGFVLLTGGYTTTGNIQALNNTNHILIPNGSLLGISVQNYSFCDLNLEYEGNIVGKWYTTTTTLIDVGNRGRGTIRFNTNASSAIGSYTGGTNLNKVGWNLALPNQYAQSGGDPINQAAIVVPGQSPVFQLGDLVATSADTHFPYFVLATNQSGTSNVVGQINATNAAIGASEKRLYALTVLTNGATNTGQVVEYINNAGTLTQTLLRTALLHTWFIPVKLAAGASGAGKAPLKFQSGTNLTSAEAGAMEYNGTNLFFTRVGTTRENVMCANAVNSVSPTSPNRTISVVIDGTTYYLAAKTTND